MELNEIFRRFNKFNEMTFNKETAIRMVELLIYKAGFTDNKNYSHLGNGYGFTQTFDYEIGEGTIWKWTKTSRYKIEIGKDFESENGWFIADIEVK